MQREQVERDAPSRPSYAVVSAEVLASTKRDGCKCEDRKHMSELGIPTLTEGMPVSALIDLESGCTRKKWVCPRLIEVRKRYGK